MIKEQKYADWSLGIHRLSVGNRIPISGTIEVTQRCNHQCAHCYVNLPINDKEARSRELTYEEHCRILDEITAAGCLWVCFTGGEIFLRKDFLDIYAYAKKKGLLPTLFTNGTLITAEIADFLVKWRPFNIEITLYGHTQKTYEKVTGAPGSYNRCLEGIHLLMVRGLPLELKAMAVTLNRHEIWDMKRFVEDDLGMEFKFDAMINPRCDCSRSPLEVRLSPAEAVELDLKDSKRVEEWKRITEEFGAHYHSRKDSDRVWQCGGGLNSFAVDAYGKLQTCVISKNEIYDLRKGSFQEGWQHFFFNLRQRKITKQTKCVTCGIKALCNMCPANAQLECMDAESPVDYLCQVAHLRAYCFGIPVPPHGDCEYCEDGSRYQEMMQTVKKLKKERSFGPL
jgi:radical SAM protein with 4Fe4S-binding SPASM domain